MRFVLALVLSLSTLSASYVMPIKAGWQLVGSPKKISDMSLFDREEVSLIWSYDPLAQVWRGYSSSETFQNAMADKGIETISELQSYQGFWINSTRAWMLELDDTASDNTTQEDGIVLYEGWNLVSLPVNMSVSPMLFGHGTLWQYKEQEWRFFDAREPDTSMTQISTITNLDGFWVLNDRNESISLADAASNLRTFETVEEMEAYIRQMRLNYSVPFLGCIMEPALFSQTMATDVIAVSDSADAALSGGSTEISDATTTNIQESGVDEADILKHDGERIFYLNKDTKTILYTTFSRLLAGTTTAQGSLDANQSTQFYEMYLQNGRLIVLGYDWQQRSSIVRIFGIDDLDAIEELNTFAIEGRYVTSRFVGGKLMVVTDFYPYVSVEYPKIYIDYDYDSCYADFADYGYAPEVCYFARMDSDGRYFRYDYEHPSIVAEHLVPTLQDDRNGTAGVLLDPQKFYAPLKNDQYPRITAITQIDPLSLSVTDSIGYLGSTRTQYASLNAFYLVSSEYPWFIDYKNYKEQSTIYKFAFDGALTYRGRGKVSGQPLNQFALSEHNRTLRIATTQGWSWLNEGTDNSIYTLAESNESTLEIEGSLNGLGKEGERIRAVRFIEDKGFVVTFLQTDPFFTLDLSDPTAPKQVGALEINGFSEYLHPVSDSLVLSIGRDADSSGRRLGLQVQLFDVSDLTQPQLADKITIGDSSYYSEAEYNHKAFTYRNSDRLFGFPYRSLYDYTGKRYFDIYRVEENATIAPVHTIEPQADSKYGWESRGLFFDYNGSTYGTFFSQGIMTIDKLGGIQ